MESIVCINIFESTDEIERNQNFNEIWQRIVKLMVNKIR